MLKFKKGGSAARKLLVGVLTVVLVVTGTGTAFAAEQPVPAQGTQEYYRFLGKSIREQVEYVAGGKGTPEYRALVEVWYRSTLQEEDLSKYTDIIPRGDVAAYKNAFYSWGDPKVMLDEIYRIADELDILNPNLSTAEKVARIDTWSNEEGRRGKLVGKAGEVSVSKATNPWATTPPDGNVYIAGPLVNLDRTIGGTTYTCSERAVGLMLLYRMAGAPAISLGMKTSQAVAGHVEAAYYLNGDWWFTAGRNYTDGSPMRFLDYAMSNAHADYTLDGTAGYTKAESIVLTDITDPILDVDEPWIDTEHTEYFMYLLRMDRYIHPEQKLTRGEVAELLCAYLWQRPMRNEPVFSDVPTSHKYAPYIWALNKLGIMTGDSGGTFRPEDELTMQEFAVVAQNMAVWGKSYLAALIASLPYSTPSFSAYAKPRWSAALPHFDPLPDSKPKVFADADRIATWAKTSVDALSQLGILSGDGNGYLKPTETLSRLRFLVFLDKFNVLLVGKEVTNLTAFLKGTGVF